VFSRTISFSDSSRPSAGLSVGGLRGGAASLVGEVCEFERYEFEFLRIPICFVSHVDSGKLRTASAYPWASQDASSVNASEASLPPSFSGGGWCDEWDVVSQSADRFVFIARESGNVGWRGVVSVMRCRDYLSVRGDKRAYEVLKRGYSSVASRRRRKVPCGGGVSRTR